MPDITLEILCGTVSLFVLLLLAVNDRIDRKNKLHTIFTFLTVVGLVNNIFGIVTLYILNNELAGGFVVTIVSLELYFNSLMIFLFASIYYSVKLINTSLPSLKKIGKPFGILMAFMYLFMNMAPIVYTAMVPAGGNYNNSGFGIFILWLLVEFIMFLVFNRNRKYINEKRINIFGVSWIGRMVCVVVQLIHPQIFFMGPAVAITTVALYMTLENEDVRLIEQLAVESKRADAANEAKTSFVANVSHEIRTPINAILGMDEIILRETKEKNIRQYAMDIKSAAQVLHSIINEILDMSKIESGKMELVPVNYNMRSLINDTVNIIQIKMDTKDLTFNVNVDSTIPSGYHGDEVRLKQILSNVLSNAVKYTNEGSVTMTISGSKVSDGKELLRFEVKDTGIGMTEENLAQLFEKFSRFDNTKNRSVEGTGLGMAITNQFLAMMNSKLNVESVYGEGSNFWFEIEQDIWDESPLGNYRKVNYDVSERYDYETSFTSAETRVLVVDDNAINRKVFKGLLKDTELKIDEAESGPECINMVRKNKYSLIFMDHMMPDMDGIECFHRIREMEDNLSKDAPVIMLTANAVVGAQDTYLQEGFDGFMAKPIVPEKLEELIKKYI